MSIFDDDDLLDTDDDRVRTPVKETPIVLNPKVDDDPLDLRCPACDAVIRCWSAPADHPVVEYRCECDDLRVFRVRGVPDAEGER